MIAEIGFYLLIMVALVSVVQIYAGFKNISNLAVMGSITSFGCLLFSFCALIWVFAITDVSVLSVVLNSHSMKPFLYKVTAVWGNHEGSMLLWVLILSLFGAWVAAFDKNLPSNFKNKTLASQGCLVLGFLSFLILTSNPFARVFPTPLDGQGLNPLLQDPGLAFHPPLLYLGYVGFSLIFAFAIAGLLTGDIHKKWAGWIRPWLLIAWTSLSAGIALGSWWAYYELGWGGWWFWDPVENVALIPWLTGTALLHCALVSEKRGSLLGWSVFLALITFITAMIGTFLVRSGVLTSVHSFATDPARGLFILCLCTIYIAAGLILFALKMPKKKKEIIFSPLSRDSFLIINNLFMVTLAITVFIGTLYPILLQSLNIQSASVGAPYFNMVFLPLSLPAILMMGLAPLLPWKNADKSHLIKTVSNIVGPIIILLFGVYILQTPSGLLEVISIFIGLWVCVSAVFILCESARYDLNRVKHIPLERWGSALAHFGVGLLVFGTLSTFVWQKDNTYLMQKNETVTLDNYNFTLQKTQKIQVDNYVSNQAILEVKNAETNDWITTLYPEKRFFPVSGHVTTEAAIHLTWRGDIYAVLGDVTPELGDKRIIKITIHPYVGLLWLGFGFIVFGGLASLTHRFKQRISSL